MLVLSKTHSLPGEVKHQPYFLLWWAGKAVVTIGMFWFQLYVWALLIPFPHHSTSPHQFNPQSPELVAWCPGADSKSTPSLFGLLDGTSWKQCLECNLSDLLAHLMKVCVLGSDPWLWKFSSLMISLFPFLSRTGNGLLEMHMVQLKLLVFLANVLYGHKGPGRHLQQLGKTKDYQVTS